MQDSPPALHRFPESTWPVSTPAMSDPDSFASAAYVAAVRATRPTGASCTWPAMASWRASSMSCAIPAPAADHALWPTHPPEYVPVTSDQKLWGAHQRARVLSPHHPLPRTWHQHADVQYKGAFQEPGCRCSSNWSHLTDIMSDIFLFLQLVRVFLGKL